MITILPAMNCPRAFLPQLRKFLASIFIGWLCASEAVASLDCAAANIKCVGAGQEYTSIQACADAASPGDVCLVFVGTYGAVTVAGKNATTINSQITFLAEGNVSITGQFLVEYSNYIRIVGFNFDGGGTVRRLLFLHDTRGVEVWNNTFRGHTGVAVETLFSSTESPHTNSSQTLIIGNKIFGRNGVENDAFSTIGDDIVFAYNEIDRTGTDYFLFYGSRNRFLNNYGHHPTESDPDDEGSGHIDFMQTGANCCDRDRDQLTTDYTFVEANYYEGGIGYHQHVNNLETFPDNSGNFLLRRNVWHYTGGAGWYDFHHVYVVNDTWSEMQVSDPGGYLAFHASRPGGNHRVFNNIFTEAWGSAPSLVTIFELQTPALDGYNLVWDWQSGAGFSSSLRGLIASEATKLVANPLYVSHAVHPTALAIDHGSDDFHIQSNSPARDSAGPVTTVTTGGTNVSSITVGDGGFFRGYNSNLPQYGGSLAAGDKITIGSQIRRVISVNGNVITLASPVTAAAAAPVYVGDDPTPDRGAFPYKSTYNITNNLSYNNGLVTATVNDPSIVRHVEFYVDGLPVAVSSDAPYVFNTAAYPHASSHTVKAVARPLYASRTLAYEDNDTFTFYRAAPQVPGNLRIVP